MKEMTRKILEAGLVDKHTAMAMERWGSLDRGASDLVGAKQVTKETFQALADDIAALLEVDQPLKETILDFEIIVGGEVIISTPYPDFHTLVGTWDEMLRLVVDPECMITIGDVVMIRTKDSGKSLPQRIINVDKVYLNEEVIALKLTTYAL